jgi:hypothetical protein
MFIAGTKSDYEMRLHALCSSPEDYDLFIAERGGFENQTVTEDYKWDREEQKKRILLNIEEPEEIDP